MDIKSIQEQLDEALKECERLRIENERLRNRLGLKIEKDSSPLLYRKPSQTFTRVTNASSSNEKIALFRSFFRGREDVYPVRWEAKNGKSGYSPACSNEWEKTYCDKPRIKCGQCNNRNLLPVTDTVIYDHLSGKHTIGIYPILSDDTCWFLAVDFDKSTWKEDASEYIKTCQKNNVPTALEKSRSGKGGHVWIFFTEPTPASTARQVGSYMLTQAMRNSPQIGFNSYDRFFPNQDTLPKGGFGNLIALPLQKEPRSQGNSVFVDTEFKPYPDQWEFLSNIEKMTRQAARDIADEAIRNKMVVGVRMSQLDEESDDNPWTNSSSIDFKEVVVSKHLPKEVAIVLADLLYIEKENIPAVLQDQLIRIAAFQNPDFYKNQAMRLPTYNKPRIISCSEAFPNHIGLPRGCLFEVSELFKSINIETKLIDKRTTGKPLSASFKGKLKDPQKPAVKALREHDFGVLSAATAFGKTIIAAKIIAVRKRSTLVLVHRRQLMDQWREKLSLFLNIPEKNIGQIGGGKNIATGRLDIGILQSLYRKGEVKQFVTEYGQIIVDECHHLSAFSFEQVMKKAKAKYVLGLTATPIRKDGHHPIIFMQCGPIRYKVEAKHAAKDRPFKHIMIPRINDGISLLQETQLSIQEIYKVLSEDEIRNNMIVSDVIEAVNEGKSPLILTERTDHIKRIAELLDKKIKNVIILRGGMSKKQRVEVAQRLDDIDDSEERVVVASGRYIGEGFDDARLDTLFLALPISWRGTLQQYAGRLHRDYDGKKEVHIYDYIDSNNPMLMRMYQKRLKGYKAIGYSIQEK
jgi:superfamily II DNA or RNA helicase